MTSLKAVVLVAGLWFLFSPPAFGQMLLTEAQAIPFAQQTLASQLEPGLPPSPFRKWFERAVGDTAGVNWQLRNCGEQKKALQSYKDDPQACVEVTAMFPNDRMVVVLTDIGAFDKSVFGKPKIRYIVVEEYGRLQELKKLSDLPAALRKTPERAKKAKAVSPALPSIAAPTTRVSLAALNSAARTEIQIAPGSAGAVIGEAPPPPPPAATPTTQKTEKSAPSAPLPGSILSKVSPVFPTFARQVNASGEVKVMVQINEQGRVTSAKAVSGHPVLQGAAEEAAKRWVFSPAILAGKAVPSQTVLVFTFVRP